MYLQMIKFDFVEQLSLLSPLAVLEIDSWYQFGWLAL